MVLNSWVRCDTIYDHRPHKAGRYIAIYRAVRDAATGRCGVRDVRAWHAYHGAVWALGRAERFREARLVECEATGDHPLGDLGTSRFYGYQGPEHCRTCHGEVGVGGKKHAHEECMARVYEAMDAVCEAVGHEAGMELFTSFFPKETVSLYLRRFLAGHSCVF